MDSNQKEATVPDVLTVRETSDFLRLRPATVYAYVEGKRIPHFKIGARVLFSRSELQGWLDSHRVPALPRKV